MTWLDRAVLCLLSAALVTATCAPVPVPAAPDGGTEGSPDLALTGSCIAWQARAEHLRTERDQLAEQVAALRAEVAALRRSAAASLDSAGSHLTGLADDLDLCVVALDAGAAAPRCDCSWWAPALIGCAACGGSVGGSWLGVELERGLGR